MQCACSVTTIAGGYTTKAGRQDGPAQNMSFSDDFELSFIPELCAILISDHGNQLVRKLNLKPEDCANGSTVAMGAVSTWALGLGLSCLLGFIVGEAPAPPSEQDMEALPNSSGETSADTLLRHQQRSC